MGVSPLSSSVCHIQVDEDGDADVSCSGRSGVEMKDAEELRPLAVSGVDVKDAEE